MGDNRPTFSKGDVNKDGKVDIMDTEMIRSNIGCNAGTLGCWAGLVGKTVEGDNPIYASDLDINGNNEIDEADLDFNNDGRIDKNDMTLAK
jgi:hypothetical protein